MISFELIQIITYLQKPLILDVLEFNYNCSKIFPNKKKNCLKSKIIFWESDINITHLN